jgi:hypothetical protein
LERKAEIVKKTRLDSSGSYQQKNAVAVEASYLVAQRIAKVKKPHTTAEELILPCAKDIVSVMMGSDYLISSQPLSLSDETIKRRIQDMAYDILSQAIDEVKSCPSSMFSIQLHESTDVTHLAQLLVYVRYVYNDDIKTEFLLCKPLETTTTSRDIFKVASNFFEEHGIEWKNLYAVCTDGAPAMCTVTTSCTQKFLFELPVPSLLSVHPLLCDLFCCFLYLTTDVFPVP